MIQFLIRHFISTPEDTGSPAVRQAYGRLSGITGIVLNLLLAGTKALAGILTGSISVMADAFNNLSDAGSSVVTLLGFRLAGKKPDADHPFGHGRIEYLSGLFVSMLILLVGVELLKSSVDKILHPSPVTFSVASALILALSILLKLWLCLFNRNLGKRINSSAMLASAADSLSDSAATAAVLIGLLAGTVTPFPVDGWIGLLVSLFIFKAGWGAAKDTIDPLLGKPADPELVSSIATTILAHPDILGIHDLVVHDYGPGRRMMSLHAEVNSCCNIMAIHDEIDNIEQELRAAYGIETVIHMDPICTDETTLHLRMLAANALHQVDPVLTLHDFRAVPGPTHTNLIFDVVAPHDFRLEESALKAAIRAQISAVDPTCLAVIQVDHSYTE